MNHLKFKMAKVEDVLGEALVMYVSTHVRMESS